MNRKNGKHIVNVEHITLRLIYSQIIFNKGKRRLQSYNPEALLNRGETLLVLCLSTYSHVEPLSLHVDAQAFRF